MSLRSFSLSALALALCLPFAAQAHKMWMLPSATNVSGADPWVTVDAAVSNDLFFPDHVPGDLSRLVITAPDGQMAKPENSVTGKYRSVFDVHLTQQGTYKLALVNAGVFASYELGGEKKRWRGDAANLAKELPAGAKNVEVNESVNRVETFVTNGKPSDAALKPGGKGLELVPVTHVTDLVAGEGATFQLLLDGKPAGDVKVTAIAGATRYRNAQDEFDATTGKDGKFTLTWPKAGMYWINASTQDDKTSVKQAKQRRLSYTATLEVLPQ
ncbi:putative GH25 family protein [Dyella sp. SG562]|uniref:DUF4198 domain-containing protein n=1 Tax=Dyella sp. SG562 TaxID=2587017 RepID=UPI00141DB4CA|nr:DUF4198 domain-containing protein [Dyella sp. SG562]NII71504.1 putative GH25 family protein [Dyella sp. SG562]